MDFQNLANQIYQQSEKVCFLQNDSFESKALSKICKLHPLLISNSISFSGTGDINYTLPELNIPFDDPARDRFFLFEKNAYLFAYALHSKSITLSSDFKEGIFLNGKKPIIADYYPLENVSYYDMVSFGEQSEYWAEIAWAMKEHETINPGILSNTPKDNKYWYKYSLKQKGLLARIYEARLAI